MDRGYVFCILLVVAFLLAMGCVSENQQSIAQIPTDVATTTQVQPTPTTPQELGNSINEPAKMEINGESFLISIDQLKFAPNNPNSHMLTIFMTVKNTGTQGLKLMCCSQITDYAEVNNPGACVAGTNLLYPGDSQSIKDIIVITSDKQYNALSKKSELTIHCMGQQSGGQEINDKASWNVNPGDLQRS
jgi:hypothetical protein